MNKDRVEIVALHNGYVVMKGTDGFEPLRSKILGRVIGIEERWASSTAILRYCKLKTYKEALLLSSFLKDVQILEDRRASYEKE